MKSNLSRTIGVFAALGSAVLVRAEGRIVAITTHKVGVGTEIEIKGEGLSRPKVTRAFANHSYILDFSATYQGDAEKVTVNDGGVKSLNYGRNTTHATRLHIRLTDTEQPTLVESANGWKVKVHVKEDEAYMAPGTSYAYVMPALEPASRLMPKAAPTPQKSVQAVTTPKMALGSLNALVVSSTTNVADQPIVDGTPVPSSVAKSDKSAAVEPANKAPKPAPVASHASYSSGSGAFDKRVTLDFANTDVVQVLKALALQANVNIVTSPDVSGKVTVSLENVSVREALDLVTTMAGVRYAKVGNTFIVTSPGRFSGALKQISGKTDDTQETRVVPIYSGMGGQIKVAIGRAIPTDGASNYVMLLPSEDITSVSSSKDAPAGPAAPGAPGAPAAPAQETQSAKATQKSGKDTYVVLVGPRAKLDEVEPEVKALDAQLCKSLMIPIPDNVVSTSSVYKTNVNSAKNLLAAICDPDRIVDLRTQPNRTQVGNVQLYASNSGTQGDQLIIMNGPKNEIDSLTAVLTQLDDPGLTNSSVSVYNVKFADPRALKEELLVQIPGLRVTLPSGSAGNQGLYVENKTKQEAATQGAGAAAGGSSAGAPTPSASTGTASSSTASAASGGATSDALGQGLSLPFAALEAGAVPMRLVLKGTKSQLDQALEYLALVDVAPKQVALEMRVMELSKTDAINAGISWDLLTGGAVRFLHLDNSTSPTQLAPQIDNTGSAHFGGHGWGLDAAAQLDKIANSSNLIARPNVLAIDGRESEIFIGDVIRYVQSILASQNGTTVTTGEVRVGVRLSVLPRVGADGGLTMELRPVVSFLTGFTPVPQIGGQLPQTSERVAQSTLTVKSGETIAIGGLIQDQDRRNAQGLPVLMNLPIVGNLFKRSQNTKVRTELVIFLTAREVDGPATSETKLPQQMDDVNPRHHK